jgi:glycosyltransferase involved in cell wall biosynthesis
MVLFTSSWYPSPKDPVLGNFVRRHAEAVATKHTVWLIYVTSANSKTPKEKFSYELVNGVHTVICYYAKSGFSTWNRWRAFKKGIHYIEKQSQKPFDIIHHNVFWPDVWQALRLSKKWRIPFIVTEHWTGFDIAERGVPANRVLRMSKWAAQKASFICPVTENLAQSMKKLGLSKNNESKYRVVTNVVDTDFFIPNPTKNQNTRRFLHLSNLLDPHKNVSGILRVWKKVTETYLNVQLTVAGDGPLEEHRLYARELNIPEETIQFMGTIPSAEVLKQMQESHVLVLFSNYENFPCVISEAYSTGLPVIATDVGGIREHLKSEQGYLIPKRDEQALYMVIEQCMNQANRFNATQLRDYALKEFSVKSIQEQFTTLYNEAIHKKR